jgi:hypothetical protein
MRGLATMRLSIYFQRHPFLDRKRVGRKVDEAFKKFDSGNDLEPFISEFTKRFEGLFDPRVPKPIVDNRDPLLATTSEDREYSVSLRGPSTLCAVVALSPILLLVSRVTWLQ